MPDLNLGDMKITSPDFAPNSDIPKEFTASGENRPPDLHWDHVPEPAVELVLIVHDPDAPLLDGFTHWAVHGIDPTSSGVRNGDFSSRHGGVVDRNSTGEAGYLGPAPPEGHGTHHYFFHLYALDAPLRSDTPVGREELLRLMDGHIIEQARLVGTFER
jgi:Raf kinase inhibitor-like YbhB/YbcL family protein